MYPMMNGIRIIMSMNRNHGTVGVVVVVVDVVEVWYVVEDEDDEEVDGATTPPLLVPFVVALILDKQ